MWKVRLSQDMIIMARFLISGQDQLASSNNKRLCLSAQEISPCSLPDAELRFEVLAFSH